MYKMEDVFFSLCVPTYNRSHLIDRVYQSAARQEYQNWQIYFCDDCSTDNTLATLESLSQSDSRVHYLNLDENSGVNKARNKVISHIQENSPESYIIFIDDDDILCDGFLYQAVKVIKNNPDYSWYAFNCIDGSGNKITRAKRYGDIVYISDYMFGKTLRGDPTNIIKASAIAEHRFTEEFKNAEEWYLWCNLSLQFPMLLVDKSGSVKEFLSDGLTSSGFNRDRIVDVAKYKIKTLEPIVGRKAMLHQYVTIAKHLINRKAYAEAYIYLKKTFVCSPFYFRQYKHWLKLGFKK